MTTDLLGILLMLFFFCWGYFAGKADAKHVQAVRTFPRITHWQRSFWNTWIGRGLIVATLAMLLAKWSGVLA